MSVNHGTPLEDLAGSRSAGCLKVFIQRDYSEGTSVRFQTKFPPELEGKIEKSVFENTINDINGMFVEAEKMSCGRYCEGCLGCLTAYLVFFCMETHYEQVGIHYLILFFFNVIYSTLYVSCHCHETGFTFYDQ
nr:golgin subfamily A member 7B-like isoform X2 [Cherax quadricarinatus]